jgi:hypothetical protein
VCRFCGRAICRSDAKKHVFVLEVYESADTHYGLAVEDALHCGVCKPKPDPVLMDFLDEPPRAAGGAGNGDERHNARVSRVTAARARLSNAGGTTAAKREGGDRSQ